MNFFSYVVEKIILQVYRIIVQENDQRHQQGRSILLVSFIPICVFRPTSTRNLNSPGGADWNQSEEGIHQIGFLPNRFLLIFDY